MDTSNNVHNAAAKKLLSREEFADLMQVKPRTIDTWLHRGKLTSNCRVRVTGRNYFRVEKAMEDLGMTLDEWLELRQRTT